MASLRVLGSALNVWAGESPLDRQGAMSGPPEWQASAGGRRFFGSATPLLAGLLCQIIGGLLEDRGCLIPLGCFPVRHNAHEGNLVFQRSFTKSLTRTSNASAMSFNVTTVGLWRPVSTLNRWARCKPERCASPSCVKPLASRIFTILFPTMRLTFVRLASCNTPRL